MQHVRDAVNFVPLSTEGYGLSLSVPGDLAISLGTSDTVFGIASDPRPGLEEHISPGPVDAEGYLVLLVYKNGSLNQEDGKMGFYCEDRETLPPSLPDGFHRYVIQDFMSEQEVEEFDPPVVCTVWEYFSYADVVHKTSVKKNTFICGFEH
ncbi:PREDICTED: xylulose kinase [Populus euphratica]|uniref:Xylulose kinase n=1 Tax=Populus euphratica TaxID=75702 RepID=A0AAJ6XFG0_POPEU|nr:PREDICTED: xylulose kinase [Populus euphratica]